jgi:tetratricopeptide (TPR) repeat protein
MVEHIPQIIAEAAKSQLGIWALIIIALGLVGFGFFRQAPLLFRAGIYVFMFIGFGLFGVAAFRVEPIPPGSQTKVQSDSRTSPEAGLLLSRATQYRLSGRNDQARAAYAEARTLYKAVEDRLGEANVLLGLGELERKLGRNDQARKYFYQAAHLYDALGLENWKELALQTAKALGSQDR